MKFLEKLFTEEEAEMYLNLSMMLETPEAVAQRIGTSSASELPKALCRAERP
jgi:hypothetical protein